MNSTDFYLHDPAFPEARLEEQPHGPGVAVVHYPGISKLEYFAGLAMQAHLAHPSNTSWDVASDSVNSAKALLAVLEKELSPPEENRSGAV